MDKNYVYILRTCNASMTSYGGFKWPVHGQVICLDWDSMPESDHGLHGVLWGVGDHRLLDWSDDANWLIVRVNSENYVKLDNGEVKFSCGYVVHCGSRDSATNFLLEEIGEPIRAIVAAKAIAGDCSTVSTGYRGTSIAGEDGTATTGGRGMSTTGNWGTSTSGNWGTSITKNRGTATSGDHGTSTAGYFGIATTGNWGTSTTKNHGTSVSGDWGISITGDNGTATTGFRGTAIAGNLGTAIAGYEGKVTAGEDGTISIKWWDSKARKPRIAIGYIGDDGLDAGKEYCLDDNHQFVEVK